VEADDDTLDREDGVFFSPSNIDKRDRTILWFLSGGIPTPNIFFVGLFSFLWFFIMSIWGWDFITIFFPLVSSSLADICFDSCLRRSSITKFLSICLKFFSIVLIFFFN
jgi:hypothetical protein